MDTLPVNEFRRQVGEYLNQAYYAGKAFTLLKGNRRMAALIPIAMLDRLVELENQLQTKVDLDSSDSFSSPPAGPLNEPANEETRS